MLDEFSLFLFWSYVCTYSLYIHTYVGILLFVGEVFLLRMNEEEQIDPFAPTHSRGL